MIRKDLLPLRFYQQLLKSLQLSPGVIDLESGIVVSNYKFSFHCRKLVKWKGTFARKLLLIFLYLVFNDLVFTSIDLGSIYLCT